MRRWRAGDEVREWEVAQAVVSYAAQVTTRARRSEAQTRTPNNRGCQNGTDLRDVVRLRVRLVRPLLGAAVHAELAPGAESIRLTLTLRRAGGDDPISDSRNGTTSGAGGAGAGGLASGRRNAGGRHSRVARESSAGAATRRGANHGVRGRRRCRAHSTSRFFSEKNPNSDDFRENMMTNKNGS